MRTTGLLCSALALTACGEDDATSSGMDASTPLDAGLRSDAGADTSSDAATDCFANPKTYLEIINACTAAEKISKAPVLPRIRADGKLPPLP
jgi:hypothetical protein